ncbi:MAG: hypothetical protein AAB345_00090 [Patescibacteria group bacterium]
MKFVVKSFTGNLSDAMRSAGYHFEGADQKTKEFKFYRSVSDNLFPRFHIYGFLDKSKTLSLSMHLDQKAPVYQGSTAHSGDYEGEVIEKEAARLRQSLASVSERKIEGLSEF